MSEFWIQTFGNQPFDLLEASPDDIDIEEIARALSQQVRYNGHCREFYSVGQHSVLVSLEIEAALRPQLNLFDHTQEDVRVASLWGLLHDAAEAYVGDVVSPMKKLMRDHDGDETGQSPFDWVEGKIQGIIARRFGLPQEMPAIVKEYDLRLLATERRDLFGPCSREWRLPYGPLDRRIVPSSSMHAVETEFLRRFERLQPARWRS